MPRRRLAGAVVACALVSAPSAASAAGPYPPPSSPSAKVSPSTIKAGQCTTFSGDGFAAGSPLVVGDDGAPSGATTTNNHGAFRIRLCYGTDARTGQHVISGTGRSPSDDEQTVSAVLTITGVEQSGTGSGGGPRGNDASTVSDPQPALRLADPENATGLIGTASAPRTASDPAGGKARSFLRLHGLAAVAAVMSLLVALVGSAWLLLVLGRRRRRLADPLTAHQPLPA